MRLTSLRLSVFVSKYPPIHPVQSSQSIFSFLFPSESTSLRASPFTGSDVPSNLNTPLENIKLPFKSLDSSLSNADSISATTRRSSTTNYTSLTSTDKSKAFINASTNEFLTRSQLLHSIHSLSSAFSHTSRPLLIFSGNALFFASVVLAASRAGRTVVFAHTVLTSTELKRIISETDPATIVVSAELRPTVVLARFEGEILCMDDMKLIVDANSGHEYPAQKKSDVAYICYTSGTTGHQQGVMISHSNVISNILQVASGGFPLRSLYPSVSHTQIAILPFSHIYGLLMLLHLPLYLRESVVILPSLRPDTLANAISRYDVGIMLIVPPIAHLLVKESTRINQSQWQSLHTVLSGASYLDRTTANRLQKKLEVEVIQGYGSTETSPVTHFLSKALVELNPGSIGALVPSTQAKICDDEGNCVAENSFGELYIKGPQVMLGYITGKDKPEDGWYKTGDIVTIDKHGLFTIVDRKRDLIKYNALQIMPSELERIILSHPAVDDVAVKGKYDELKGCELPQAFVQASSSADTELLPNIIQSWVADRVSDYKKLRGGVILVKSIPRNAAGKILRHMLTANELTGLER